MARWASKVLGAVADARTVDRPPANGEMQGDLDAHATKVAHGDHAWGKEGNGLSEM